MTVKKWFESLGMSPVMQMLLRGVMSARVPGLWESEIGVQIDRDAGVVTMLLNGEPEWVKTFEEVENLVNEKADIHGPRDIVAGGPGVESASIPGQDPD